MDPWHTTFASIIDGGVTMNGKRNAGILMAGLLCAWFAFLPEKSMAQGNLFGQLVAASKTEVEKRDGKLSVGMTDKLKPVLRNSEGFPVRQRDHLHASADGRTMQRMLMESKAGRPPTSMFPLFELVGYLKEDVC
jgi:hypothetical protein